MSSFDKAERDYEARMDALAGADPNEFEIQLTLGDDTVPVYYTVSDGGPCITRVGSFNADPDCFSSWQLDSWYRSIERDMQDQQDAWEDAR